MQVIKLRIIHLILPLVESTIWMKRKIISSLGVDPSIKNKSWCSKPASVNLENPIEIEYNFLFYHLEPFRIIDFLIKPNYSRHII
jgi:hypothetical protein